MLKTLPIFAKELFEVAGRASTYWIRVAYAVVIGALFYRTLEEIGYRGTNIDALMGSGSRLYNALITTQFFLTLLVVPPLVASAVTREKENGTIEVLLSIPMSSAKLLLQKLAGRLIPVFSLILIGLPLLGITFLLGGVTARMVYLGTLNCLLIAMSVGALSLAVSCVRNSSTRAILETYAYLVVLGPTCLSPIAVTSMSGRTAPIAMAVVISILFTVPAFIFAVRKFREKARFAPPPAPGYVLHEPRARKVHTADRPTPKDKPLVWLEQIRRPLTLGEYAGVSIPLVLAFVALSDSDYRGLLGFFNLVLALMALGTFFQGSTTLLHLKKSEVLPILLSTPMPPREIIHEIHRGGQLRTMQYLIPLTMIAVSGTILAYFQVTRHPVHWAPPLIMLFLLSALAWIYFQVLSWLSLLTVLITRSHFQATLSKAAFIAVFFVLAPLFLTLGTGSLSHDLSETFHPFFFLPLLEDFANTRHFQPADFLIREIPLHLVLWLAISFVLRTVTLRGADRWLSASASATASKQ